MLDTGILNRFVLLHRLVQIIENSLLVRATTVELKACIAKVCLEESSFHDFESCHLFCHEEHCLAAMDGVSDHVGDCLGFSCPGRSLYYHCFGGSGRPKTFDLRAVSVQDRAWL